MPPSQALPRRPRPPKLTPSTQYHTEYPLILSATLPALYDALRALLNFTCAAPQDFHSSSSGLTWTSNIPCTNTRNDLDVLGEYKNARVQGRSAWQQKTRQLDGRGGLGRTIGMSGVGSEVDAMLMVLDRLVWGGRDGEDARRRRRNPESRLR